MASSSRTMLPSAIMAIEGKKLGEFVQRTWDAAIVPALTEYVRIPAKSPMFDREWAEHGHLDRDVGAVEDDRRAAGGGRPSRRAHARPPHGGPRSEWRDRAPLRPL